MKDDVPLGKLAPETATRDAIHLAVAPLVAGQKLDPGDYIGLGSNGEAFLRDRDTDSFGASIGIVDPFLRRSVNKGERFYGVLLPNTITGMHHEWRHPAFDALPTREQVDVSHATTVLNKYAREQGVSYGRLMDIIDSGSRGKDEHMDSQVPDYIWDAWESVTGEKADSDRREQYFSCAC